MYLYSLPIDGKPKFLYGSYKKNILLIFNLFLLMDKTYCTFWLEKQMFKNIALIIMMKNSNKLFGCKITNKKKRILHIKAIFVFFEV